METIKRMYEHLHWANTRILNALQKLQGDGSEAVRLFSHILRAERVWIDRLNEKQGEMLPLWQEDDLEACAQLADRNAAQFRELLTLWSAGDPDALVSYTNSSGTRFETSVRDVLTHVALHGHYHRGQINALLRAAGSEPVSIDYIAYVRTRDQEKR